MNCVLAATFADLDARLVAQELPCIRCGDCATVCPAALLPQQLHRAALAGDAAGLLRFGIWDCIDCGCCDFVCPSQIPLAWRFREARRDLRAQEAAAEKAAAARERFERRERRLQDAAAAEQCVLDAVRQQARANAGTPATPPTDRAE
jgi:electron transport complex protein RnfC